MGLRLLDVKLSVEAIADLNEGDGHHHCDDDGFNDPVKGSSLPVDLNDQLHVLTSF